MARQPFGSSKGNVRPIVPISGTSRRRRGGGGGTGGGTAAKATTTAAKSKDLTLSASAATAKNDRRQLSTSKALAEKLTAATTTSSSSLSQRRSKFKSSSSSSLSLEAAARHYDDDDQSAILSSSSAGNGNANANFNGSDDGSDASPATNATVASRTGGTHRREGDDGLVQWQRMRMVQHRRTQEQQRMAEQQKKQEQKKQLKWQQARNRKESGRPPLPRPPLRTATATTAASTTSISQQRTMVGSGSGRFVDSHNAKTPKIANRQDRKKKKKDVHHHQHHRQQQLESSSSPAANANANANARTPSKPRIVGRTEPLEPSTSSSKKKRMKTDEDDIDVGLGIATSSSTRRRSIEIYEDPPPPPPSSFAGMVKAEGADSISTSSVAGAAASSTTRTTTTTATAVAVRKRAPRPSFLPPRPPGLGESPLVPPLPAPSKPGPAARPTGTSPHSPDAMDCSPDERGLGLSSSGSSTSSPDDDSPELRDKIAAAAAAGGGAARGSTGMMAAVTTTKTTTTLTTKNPVASAAGGGGVNGHGCGGKPRFAFRSPETVTRRNEEEKKADASMSHRPVTRDDLDRARCSDPENGEVMTALLRSDAGRQNAHRSAVASRSTAFNSTALVGAVIGGQELRRSHSLDESEMTAHTAGYSRRQRLEESAIPPSMALNDRTIADVDDEADDDTSVASEDSTEEKLAFILDQLPPGWEIRLSRSKGKPYYRHPDFGQTWYCPVKIDYDRFSPRTPPTPTTASESGASCESPASVAALRDDGSRASPPGSEPYGGRFEGDCGSTGHLSGNSFDSRLLTAAEERVEVVDKHEHQNSDLHKYRISHYGSAVDNLTQPFSPESATDHDSNRTDKAGRVLEVGDNRNMEDNTSHIGHEEHRQDQMSNTSDATGDGNAVGFLETRIDDDFAEQGQEEQSEQSPSISVVSTVGFASKEGLVKLLNQVSEEHPSNKAALLGQDKSSSTEPEEKPPNGDMFYDGNDDNGGFPLADDEEEDEEQMDRTLSPTLLSPQQENRKSVCASPTDSLNLMDVDDEKDIDEKENDDEASVSSKEKILDGGNQDNVEGEDHDDNDVGSFPLGDFEDDDQTDIPSSPSSLNHKSDKENEVAAVKLESRNVQKETGGFIEEIEIDSSDDDALSSIHMGELPIKRGHQLDPSSSRIHDDDASLGSWRTLCGPDRPRCSLQHIDVLLQEQQKRRKMRRNTSTGGTKKKKRTKHSRAGISGEKTNSSKKKATVKQET